MIVFILKLRKKLLNSREIDTHKFCVHSSMKEKHPYYISSPSYRIFKYALMTTILKDVNERITIVPNTYNTE